MHWVRSRSAVMSRKNIYIYDGEGVSPENPSQVKESLEKHLSKKYAVSFITPEQTIQGDWIKTAAAYVIGGGYDLGFINALGNTGSDLIKDYIKSGGRYLGICAGAYFGCDHIMFDKGGIQEVCGQRRLKFFPGVCVGPVYGPYNYYVNISARAAPIQCFEPKTKKPVLFSGFYSGGGMFIPYTMTDFTIRKTPETYPYKIREDLDKGVKEQIQQRHKLGIYSSAKKRKLIEASSSECSDKFSDVMMNEIETVKKTKEDNCNEDMGSLIEVLSRYCDVEGSPIASVKCRLGKGIAVLSAMHLECDSKSIDEKDEYLKPIQQEICKHDAEQNMGFVYMLQHLELNLKNRDQ